jgi:hypothetical protein
MMRIGMIAPARDYRQNDVHRVMGVTTLDLLNQATNMGLTWTDRGMVSCVRRGDRRNVRMQRDPKEGMLGKASGKLS